MIFVNVTTLEIIKQFPTTRDQLQQAATGIIVLLMNLKMFSQFVNTLREQSDLHLRRTGVRTVYLVVTYYFFF